ncbi:hypothetical protein FDI69_gp123 [Rhodococcus phage Trina]|uniref:Uncharacterized protein n=1 Tax=Rhodococcus phage Trina TaxID=2027905 RepID=A0A2D1A2N0_9CAUD|nr:hypothetical protein FDI69_gp002 [Rhodococcus phage Trina]YP_009615270.1 hypothetical protein FDI69_gp123 [Rhodococcus phage Trina]ASZ74821.1 hypothetical protein SEA_TRINA_2 [Rhodococcus phage Trina]ASZ75062.1 hypothetical protein SEA_TRINA_284 [Rhodococcus phage Trina]
MITLAKETDYITITGVQAISCAMDMRKGTIEQTRSGRCCDTGPFSNTRESDREELLYSLLIWRDSPERISMTFIPDRLWSDAPDWNNPVSVMIDSGDACEPHEYRFDYVPHGFQWPNENIDNRYL